MENLQPKLRFPEFKEDWKQSTISSEFSIFNGYAFKSSDSTLEGVRWIKIADVDINKISNDNLSYLPDNYLNKYDKFSLKKGDYVIALTRPILNNRLKIAKIDDSSNNSLLNQRVGKIISNNNLDYVYYYLQRNKIINLINDKIAGNDPPNLSPKEINSIKFSTPTLQEQTKIADFLGAVDKQLDILNQKKEKLTTYKKGVMQQLFSQQIRFKDDNGNDFPDWEEKTLGEVLKYTQPNKFIVKSTDYNDLYNTPVLTAGKSFLLGYTNETDNIYKDIPCIIFDDFTTSSQFVDFNFKIKSSAMKILNTIGEDNIKFLFELINTIQFPKGDEHKRYWISEYSKLVLNIPSIEEQNKIADFLSAIDKQIETVSAQIQKTENYKKGLLQQMFV